MKHFSRGSYCSLQTGLLPACQVEGGKSSSLTKSFEQWVRELITSTDLACKTAAKDYAMGYLPGPGGSDVQGLMMAFLFEELSKYFQNESTLMGLDDVRDALLDKMFINRETWSNIVAKYEPCEGKTFWSFIYTKARWVILDAIKKKKEEPSVSSLEELAAQRLSGEEALMEGIESLLHEVGAENEALEVQAEANQLEEVVGQLLERLPLEKQELLRAKFAKELGDKRCGDRYKELAKQRGVKEGAIRSAACRVWSNFVKDLQSELCKMNDRYEDLLENKEMEQVLYHIVAKELRLLELRGGRD